MNYINLLFCLFLFGCSYGKFPGSENCNPVCDHFKSLSCEEGDDLDSEITCVKFCQDTFKNGHMLDLNCLIEIKSCEQIQYCY